MMCVQTILLWYMLLSSTFRERAVHSVNRMFSMLSVCLRIKILFFNSYIYTLFLNCFSVIFVKIRRELSEIRGAEMLFIEVFGHDVQMSTNHVVCVFAKSLDNIFHAALAHYREDRDKCKYLLL